MERIYFVIEVDGQDNVGNIAVDTARVTEDNLSLVIEIMKPKVIQAIKGHFDSDLVILNVECNDLSYSPIFTFTVALEDDNEEDETTVTQEVTLVTTWVY